MTEFLGDYARYVLSAYGVSIALLVGLVWLSLAQARKAKTRLQAIEDRMKRNG